MLNLLKHIQRNLVWLIPIMMLAGFLTGITIDSSMLKQLIIPLTFQFVTQLLNFTVIPLIAFGLGKVAFPDSPYITLGLLLASLLPTSGMTISWTGMARGNVPAAIKLLAEENIHSVAVLDDNNKPVGMVSIGNLIDALVDETHFDAPLSSISLEPVVIAPPEMPLKRVLKKMKRKHEYKALVLDDQGMVSSVITSEELMHFLLDQAY